MKEREKERRETETERDRDRDRESGYREKSPKLHPLFVLLSSRP